MYLLGSSGFGNHRSEQIMKKLATLVMTLSFFLTSTQTTLAFTPESQLDRDYQTVKGIVYTGLTLAAMAGLAALGWGAMDYAQDYEKEPAMADGLATVYRGAAEPGDSMVDKGKRKILNWAVQQQTKHAEKGCRKRQKRYTKSLWLNLYMA